MALGLLASASAAARPQPDAGPPGSIAQEEDWLIARQSDHGGCQLLPAARVPLSKLDFIIRSDGIPVLLTPYRRGFKGYVVFTVDRRPPLFIAASLVEDPETFVLPETILRDLKAGRSLTVWLQPANAKAQEQTFSLIGLTAALDWLERTECRVQEADGSPEGLPETR